MEVDAGSCLFLEKKSFEGFVTNNDSKKPVENNPNAPVYVNHAANAWHENRKKWTGDLHQKAKRVEKDPIIRLSARGADLQCATNYLAYRLWSTTYEDLLSTNEPFHERIPLSEMVDFLVDIWLDEGLFD